MIQDAIKIEEAVIIFGDNWMNSKETFSVRIRQL